MCSPVNFDSSPTPAKICRNPIQFASRRSCCCSNKAENLAPQRAADGINYVSFNMKLSEAKGAYKTLSLKLIVNKTCLSEIKCRFIKIYKDKKNYVAMFTNSSLCRIEQRNAVVLLGIHLVTVYRLYHGLNNI